METATLIGLLAGTLTTISFLPQVVKAWRSRSTKDLSVWMYLVFAAGAILWTVYGVMLDSLPVILANSVTLLLIGVILYLKARYR